MEFNDLLKLLDAGFTKDEIMRFASAEEHAEDLHAEDLHAEDLHAEDLPEKPAESALGEILREMKNVVQEIQKANMFRASLPGPGDGDNVDSILASIINPRKETA